MMDDFTAENGATGVLPGRQTVCQWPGADEWAQRHIQVEGGKGTAMLFPGLLPHASMANRSDGWRTSVLAQYLPAFVRPMEDPDASVGDGPRARATPRMRQLLGMEQLYPKVFDPDVLEQPGGEGRED